MVNPGVWFEESEHPRAPQGSPTGGQFVAKGGGDGKVAMILTLPNGVRAKVSATKVDRTAPRKPILRDSVLPTQSITAKAFRMGGVNDIVDIEVLVNPSEHDVLQLSREASDQRTTGNSVVAFRSLRDRNANLFVWAARDAIHSDIESSLGEISNHSVLFDITTEDTWSVTGGVLPRYAQSIIRKGQDNAKRYVEQYGSLDLAVPQTVHAWHATLSPEYLPTAGAHFGTKQAASQRVVELMKMPPESRPIMTPRHPRPIIHEVDLELGKVVELQDMGEWWPADITQQLLKSGVMTQKEFDEIESKVDFDPMIYLRDKGFDTIAYKNANEDKGAYSYIPLRRENIHYLNTGTFVPGYSPGVHAIHDENKIKETKAAWILDSPIRTLQQALASGPKAQDQLAKVANDISAKLGVKFNNPGPKNKSPEGVQRIREKIELRGSIAAVTDIARGTFIINHPKECETIANELGKHFEVVLEDWRKNDQGYLDRSAMVRFEDGLIGEIQFMDAGMAKAKSDKGGNGHGMYVEYRGIDKSTPKGKAKADTLRERMVALYNSVTTSYSAEWKAVLGNAGT